MAEIKIRNWLQSDFKSVRNILLQTWLDTYSFIPVDDIKFHLEKYYNEQKLNLLYSDPDTFCFIAEANKQPIGWMKLFNNHSQNRFYLSSLYVLPEYQGYGVGKLFMIKAEEIAKDKNYDRLWLGVMNDNTKALNWYKKLGFIFTEEEPFQMGNTKVMHSIGYKLI
jgi:ribosomal protein S18 acetylase RimI-like enzyme